ncbi:MAG: GNAT family N-acetyltransferase [Bacteroidota bacterium]|nr:GNAT family N-acetyltransferase [Bacteroidota bacterium]
MMNISYKKAIPEDAHLISVLAESIWKKHYITIISQEQIDFMLDKMYSEKSLLQQMKEGHEFSIVYDNGIAVGYISLSTKDDRNYFLHKFYIETGDQRKGIGSQLFAKILSDLKAAESIELTVNRKNYKAINFYFKVGFVIKEVADFDIGNGYFMNDFIMIYRLK